MIASQKHRGELADSEDDQLKRLHLLAPESYHYLNQSGCTSDLM